MRNNIVLALSLAAIVLPASAATAATTVNVDVSTGQGPNGTVDANWKINGGNAYIPVSVHPNWVAGTANSGAFKWITPDANGAATQPAGDSVYSMLFTLPTLGQLTSAVLSGTFWADNRVTSIFVNGTQIYTNLSGDQFSGSGTSFGTSDLSAFLQGTNTLTFNVRNDSGNSGNPAGLRVSGSVFAAAVPEPGSWMLMMLGIGAVGFAMRRRQKTQVRFQFA